MAALSPIRKKSHKTACTVHLFFYTLNMETNSLLPYEIEMAAQLWPQSLFASHEAWLAYVNKWWPRLPKIVEALDAAKA